MVSIGFLNHFKPSTLPGSRHRRLDPPQLQLILLLEEVMSRR